MGRLSDAVRYSQSGAAGGRSLPDRRSWDEDGRRVTSQNETGTEMVPVSRRKQWGRLEDLNFWQIAGEASRDPF
jgi:hypothetical protein